jgi:hypothetical protein
VRIKWDAALDTNANPVAGYNIYRAGTAGGPFSRINTALVTGTVFFDTDSGGGIEAANATGGSGYYVVTAVDAGGTESVHSLAVKPASMASGGSAGSSSLAGCFITTVQDTLPAKAGWMVVILMVVLTVGIGFRFRVSGVRQKD